MWGFMKMTDNERVKYFRMLVERQPNDPINYDHLAHALYKNNDYKGSIECYKKSIALGSCNPMSYNNLGFILRERELYDEAIEWLNKGLLKHPNDAEHYNNLGAALLGKNKNVDAIKVFAKAIKLNPKNDVYYNNLAIGLMQEKKYEEAKVNCEISIKLNIGCAKYHNDLGLILYNLRKYEDALACFEKAVQLDPENINYGKNIIILKGNYDIMECSEVDKKADDARVTKRIDENTENVSALELSVDSTKYDDKIDQEHLSCTKLSIEEFTKNTEDYLFKVGGFELLDKFLFHKKNLAQRLIEMNLDSSLSEDSGYSDYSTKLSIEELIKNTADYLFQEGGFELLDKFLFHKNSLVPYLIENNLDIGSIDDSHCSSLSGDNSDSDYYTNSHS
jgi:tetratricopeptide (TPR) repeat protein